MYHIKADQRSLRTAETIYTVLAQLIGEKPFDNIKVSELIVRAEIGRSTFYRNFDQIEDVLRWRTDQVMDEFIQYVQLFQQKQPLIGLLPMLKPVLRFFYLDSTIIELLIAADRIDILQSALQKRLPSLTPAGIGIVGVPQEHLAYWPIIRSNAAVGVLTHWVKSGKCQAPDALADGLSESLKQLHAQM